MGVTVTGATGIDTGHLQAWLAASVDATIAVTGVRPLAGGNSSGALRIDVDTAAGPRALVARLANASNIVYRHDPCLEAALLGTIQRTGGPAPEILAIDTEGGALGRPGFVMAFVEGRPVPDPPGAGHHGEGWFRDADALTQRALWFAFIDALAVVHRVDPSAARAQPDRVGCRAYLDYWRASLLDAAPAERVPRQLKLLDRLGEYLPADADDQPAICMGDARPGNAIVSATGTEVLALIDFEVAYVGNPAADIGYCLVFDAITRMLADQPVAGIPAADETWERWSAASGRSVDDRDYWTAFGAAIMCITGTRAMLSWGMALETIEADNIIIGHWEALLDRLPPYSGLARRRQP